MLDITGIVEAVFALVGVVITAVVIPYIRSRTSAQERAELAAWVKIAVSAAEQVYAGPGRGKEKKEFVLSWLREHGVTVDGKKLDAVVESAVFQLKSGALAAEAA